MGEYKVSLDGQANISHTPERAWPDGRILGRISMVFAVRVDVEEELEAWFELQSPTQEEETASNSIESVNQLLALSRQKANESSPASSLEVARVENQPTKVGTIGEGDSLKVGNFDSSAMKVRNPDSHVEIRNCASNEKANRTEEVIRPEIVSEEAACSGRGSELVESLGNGEIEQLATCADAGGRGGSTPASSEM
jgi:hypothetical protein